MSNFIILFIVALYIYYNKSDEECKGQNLSVSTLVSQLGGKELVDFPSWILMSLINLGSMQVTIYNFSCHCTKSPTLNIIHLLLNVTVNIPQVVNNVKDKLCPFYFFE